MQAPMRLSYCPGCFTVWTSPAGKPHRLCTKCDRCDDQACQCNAALRNPPLVVMNDADFEAFLKEVLGATPPSVPRLMLALGFRTNAYTQGPWSHAPTAASSSAKATSKISASSFTNTATSSATPTSATQP